MASFYSCYAQDVSSSSKVENILVVEGDTVVLTPEVLADFITNNNTTLAVNTLKANPDLAKTMGKVETNTFLASLSADQVNNLPLSIRAYNTHAAKYFNDNIVEYLEISNIEKIGDILAN